jgi:hypothetical protein
MRIFSALLSLCLILSPTNAYGWNDRGHMSVAGVAWRYMTPAARARAIALLRLNPDYARWIAGVAPENRDAVAFMQAATWPDKLRGRVCTDRPNCIRDDGYTPPDAGSDQNIGYRDNRLRAYWHFMDLPFPSDGTATHEPFRYNAESQILAFSRSLADAQLGDEAKSFDLTWLLHIVGDVHQPLHATARFNQNFRSGDNGGNGVTVCHPTPARCVTSGRDALKLHTVWDRAFGVENDPTDVMQAVKDMVDEIDAAQPNALRDDLATVYLDAAPHAWFEESRAFAILYAYAPPVGQDDGHFVLNPAYETDMARVAKLRIASAGIRLARLLNRVLA